MALLDKIKNQIEKQEDLKEQYYEQSGASWLRTIFNNGTKGEYPIYKKLVNVPGYNKCVANCYLPKDDGTTTEIDLLMIHETGIYVIESKNYIGYIFGSSKRRYWTQTLNAGRGRIEKHQFYNPVLQNKAHIRQLKEIVGSFVPMYSYIVFGDKCEFKNLELDGTCRVIYRSELMRALKMDINEKSKVLTESQIDALFEKLDSLSHSDTNKKKEHVVEIKQERERIEKDISNEICPKCGGKLVLRTATKGPNAGSKFYGCSNYPKCKFTAKAPTGLKLLIKEIEQKNQK